MRYQPYPAYKESGVEWLGKIPEGWELRPLKWYSKCYSGASISDGFFSIDDGSPELYQVFGGNGLVGFYSDFNAETGQLVIGRVGALCGNVRLLCSPVWVSDNALILKVTRSGINPDFLYWLLTSRNLNTIASKTAQPLLTATQIGEHYIPASDIPTQKAIAAFLDTETARIDGLVKDYEELITLLQEKRQALISHAVTRGLSELVSSDDPEFGAWAKPVRFKDSGVEWLGQIPEGWIAVRFSHYISIQEGQVDPSDESQKDLLLIAPNHIESGTGRLILMETASEQGAESGKYPCLKGDVVYSKIRPKLAKVAIAPEDCLCSADMYPIRGGDNFGASFLLFFLLTPEFTNWAVLESERVAMPKINRDSLGAVHLPKPPLNEQRAIASFLDRETVKMDTLVAEAQSAIELLKEHRAALIANAVTGKINVEGLV